MAKKKTKTFNLVLDNPKILFPQEELSHRRIKNGTRNIQIIPIKRRVGGLPYL